MYFVYHIHSVGMTLDQGYIGLSSNPKERWSRHKSISSDSNPLLKRAILKYRPRFSIIGVYETLSEAQWQEFTLRPFPRMGWNLCVGGGLPPSTAGWNKGLRTPTEVRQKQSQARLGRFSGKAHPRHKTADIFCHRTKAPLAKNVCIRSWAKANGYHQGHLSATARGVSKQHKGVFARYVK